MVETKSIAVENILKCVKVELTIKKHTNVVHTAVCTQHPGVHTAVCTQHPGVHTAVSTQHLGRT